MGIIVDDGNLYVEAEACRQKALSYLGKLEAPFLLRIAREFDRLATKPGADGASTPHSTTRLRG